MTGSYSYAGATASQTTAYNWSQTVSSSSSTTETESHATTRSMSWSVHAGPKSIGYIELLAYQTTIEIPFSTVAVVDGALEANDSGVTNASELLSEAERTMTLSGVLRISDVSNGAFSTSQLPGAPKCDGTDAGNLVIQKNAVILPPDYKADKQKFLSAKEIAAKFAAKGAKGHAFTTSDDGPTIGAPADGTSYEVIYTTEIYQPAPECGFNDLGVPILGVYNREARRYRTYNGGQLVAEWETSVDTFNRCSSP